MLQLCHNGKEMEEKWKRKGIIQIGIGVLLIILLIILVINIGINNKGLSILNIGIVTFGGYDWNYEINHLNEVGGCSGSAIGGDTLTLNARFSGGSSGGGCQVTAVTQKPINDVDEIEVVFTSTHSAEFETGTSAGVLLTDGSRTARGEIIGLLGYTDGVGANQDQFFDFKYVGIKNNHDGTYSLIRGTSLADLVVVQKYTAPSPTTPVYLALKAEGGGGAGGGKASVTFTAYNVIQRVNRFAVCKADQLGVDKNADGKITPDECTQISGLDLLNKEEFQESINTQLARIEAENQAKVLDLQQQIILLNQQLQSGASQQQTTLQDEINKLQSQVTITTSEQQKFLLEQEVQRLRNEQLLTSSQDRIFALEAQLKDTKSILADVQAEDKNVIAVVQQQEQFQRPNKLKEFWNKVWVWIKNLFS